MALEKPYKSLFSTCGGFPISNRLFLFSFLV
jgi:hypothetical protein